MSAPRPLIDDALDKALAAPQVRLWGPIDDRWLERLLEQAEGADGEGPLAIEVFTLGGDADVGRRLAAEIGLLQRRLDRRVVFLGKTAVYSAGVRIMAGFRREDRFLTPDACLLIHERQLSKTLELNGPLQSCRPRVEAVLAEIESGLRFQREGFASLVAGRRDHGRVDAEGGDQLVRTGGRGRGAGTGRRGLASRRPAPDG